MTRFRAGITAATIGELSVASVASRAMAQGDDGGHSGARCGTLAAPAAPGTYEAHIR